MTDARATERKVQMLLGVADALAEIGATKSLDAVLEASALIRQQAAEIERLRHAMSVTAGMPQCAIDPSRAYHRGDVITLSHRGCVFGTFTFSQALDLANEVLGARND